MPLTTEQQNSYDRAERAGKEAEDRALKNLDRRMKEKTGGVLSFDQMPREVRAALRVGIKEGIKATLEVMVEMLAEDMPPEVLDKANAEVAEILAGQEKS